MIIKQLKKPIHLYQIEALLRRIPIQHPKRGQIEEVYKKGLAGYMGEKSLSYPLSYLQKDKYFILHDLRLNDGTHFFQLDTLILSNNFFLIIEVKNIIGTLNFDTNFNQLIRSKDDQEEAFPDPIFQVSRHRLQFKAWLERNFPQFSSVPIEVLVVISNDKSVIKTTDKGLTISKKVIRGPLLPSRINSFATHFSKEKVTTNKLRNFAEILPQYHVPLNQNPLKRFNIQQTELIKGVQCPECYRIPMKRIHGKWLCEACGNATKNSHIHALQDYCLLINPVITNKEARDFLNVSSGSVVKRLLQSIPIKTEGMKKVKKYTLSFEVLNRLSNVK